MALQTSGPISLNDMHVEAGGGSGTACTINDADIRGLIDKASGATMSFNEWYGAASYTNPTINIGEWSAANLASKGWIVNDTGIFYNGSYANWPWDASMYIDIPAAQANNVAVSVTYSGSLPHRRRVRLDASTGAQLAFTSNYDLASPMTVSASMSSYDWIRIWYYGGDDFGTTPITTHNVVVTLT